MSEEELSNSSNIIGKGTTVEGNLESFGNIRVEGRIVGCIKSKSKVALGQSSYVKGDILAQNAEISGEVDGRVQISDLLILKATAVISGDIVTNKFIVESGATFNGSCKMGVANMEIKIGENGQKKEQPTEQPKEQPKDQSREQSKEPSREQPKDLSKEQPKGLFREQSSQQPKPGETKGPETGPGKSIR